jgi:hypothetical protein
MTQFLVSFFDGLCGSVVGVITTIAMQIHKASVEGLIEKSIREPLVKWSTRGRQRFSMSLH